METGNRARDPEHTRAIVIDAAERLFAERGFAATSMRDISAASGVSHPLIHHHFGSKEDLYAAVKRRMVEGYARRFPAAARAGNRPLTVRSEMRRIMTYLSENPVMLRLCGWTRLEGDVQVWPGEPDLLDTLRSRVAAAQRRGRFRKDLDPAVLSLMIFGLILFWVENRAHFAERFRGRIVDETYFRQAVALIERGIAPGLCEAERIRQSSAPQPELRVRSEDTSEEE
jgi:TetR/AcrR family transcriptional regulator